MKLPGQIEAEAFATQSGHSVVLPSGDENQTAAITFLGKGASVAYPVTISQASAYQITYRVRNVARRKVSFTLRLNDEILHTVTVKRDQRHPFGWQEVTATAELPAGEHTLRLVAHQSGGSVNWWQASSGAENARIAARAGQVDSGIVDDFAVYPNPATTGQVRLRIPGKEAVRVALYDLQGKPVLERTLRSHTSELDVQKLPTGLYLIRVQATDRVYQQQLLIDP